MSVQVPVSGLPTRRDPRTAQPSRKGKKAWRRNIDSSDADAALQGRADEQRLGGRRLAETENEGLFVIDAKGDEDRGYLEGGVFPHLMSRLTPPLGSLVHHSVDKNDKSSKSTS